MQKNARKSFSIDENYKSNKNSKMKKLALGALLVAGLMSAQEATNSNATPAFSGKGDQKAQVGLNLQDMGTGIMVSYDYGLGESFSFGFQAGYLLGVKEVLSDKPKFGDRVDLKARANAHLGKVIGFPENLDLYPGLDLGLKNFGAHVGIRYFFTHGFGVFAETQFPIAKYNTNGNGFDYLNNQFNVSVGASFDISKR